MPEELFKALQALLPAYTVIEDVGQLAQSPPPIQCPAALIRYDGDANFKLSHRRLYLRDKVTITIVWQSAERQSSILPPAIPQPQPQQARDTLTGLHATPILSTRSIVLQSTTSSTDGHYHTQSAQYLIQ